MLCLWGSFLSFPLFQRSQFYLCIFRYLRTSFHYILSSFLVVSQDKSRLSPFIPSWLEAQELLFYFSKIAYFLSSLSSQQNLVEGAEISHLPSTPTFILPPLSSTHQSSMLATIDEPTMAYPYHSESIVYIRIHSWC